MKVSKICFGRLRLMTITTRTIKYTVKLSYVYPALEQETLSIEGLDVYLCKYEDLYQADIVYKENTYTIVANNYESLENFIKNLEEK